MDNKKYFLALNRIYRVGPLTVTKLLKRWPHLQEMFELSERALIQAGLPQLLANAISSFDIQIIQEDLLWEDSKQNHHIITWEDSYYPRLLKEIYNPPVVLYACGDLLSLEQKAIAVVGTRKPSALGRENALQFARELCLQNITIVSGLALGVDAQAHQGCLDVGGRTIAVMGTGIDIIYPWRHRGLSDLISQNGLLLSEFPLKSAPIAGHFPRRNRIISGLASITLIVEAALRSGSLITARLALEQNRDVLAIPGSIHNPQARGCNHLVQQGAKLVTSVQEVLDEMPEYDDAKGVNAIPSQEVTKLALESHSLVEFMGDDVVTASQLVLRSGFEMSNVLCSLANLELQGMIKAVTGGYTRCL